MTTVTAARAAGRAATSVGRRISWLALRQVRRGAVVVVVLCAGMSAVVAATYDGVIAGAPGGARALAVLAGNPAIRTLFGEPVALDTAGGFTVWRVGTVLAVLVGVWAAVTACRVLRGEEDTGRWDLLLAGRVPLTGVVHRHLGVLTGVVTLVGAAVAIALLAVGVEPMGALVHGLSLALVGAFFVGIGAVAAQLWPSRGAAVGASVAVLIVGLLARMIGDGVDGWGWLRWLSPFGLAALARPFATDRVLPLVVLAGYAAAVMAAATVAARRRDVRAGVLFAGRRRSWMALLGSVPAFAVRSVLGPLAGWLLGVCAFYLLIGLISASMIGFLGDNPQFAALARQAGFELDAVEGYVATLFALLAVPVAGFTTTRVAALARAEAARLLDLLLAAPITRVHLFTAQAAAAAAAAVLITSAAAVVTWVGTTGAGSGLGLGAALAGALNTLSLAALSLGMALIALGWAPRAVGVVGMLPAAGGFLLTVLADSVDAPAWITTVSPFAHLAPVPATGPDLSGAIAMVAVAAALGVVGGVGYHRRDIRHD